MTRPICFLDTETDGVHPARRPWEIAMIRREAGEELVTSFFVEIDLSTADPFGLQVGKFYDRHPAGIGIRAGGPPLGIAYSAKETARKVAQFTHGAHIVGAVPNFDTETLAPLLRENGLTPAWSHRLIDVRTLATGWLAGRGQPIVTGVGTTEVTTALGLEPIPAAERHTALGDARWAMHIYDAVMNSQEPA